MNGKILTSLFAGLLLAGAFGVASAQEVKCTKDESPMPPCLGDPRTPMVNLNLKNMEAHPRCVRAHPGTTLVFRLTPKISLQLKTIEIFPKDDADDWLVADNGTNEDLIVIRIPEDLEPGEYDYGIKTPDSCVDPRINVEH